MNRSFRAQDSQMQMQMQAALVKQRQQLKASMVREKEEELALFLEMKKSEKGQNNLLLNNPEELDAPLGSKPGTSPIFNLSSAALPKKTAADDFLDSDGDKNDYEWLLTPPGTPLFPSLEMESQKTVMSQLGAPKAHPGTLKSRLANPQPDAAARSHLISKQAASSPGLNTLGTGICRPSSSGGPGSRPATPTGRPTLTTASKPSRSSTPTARATLPSSKPIVSATKPTTSTSKSAASTTKPTFPARSSTPSRSTRSSTPTARAFIPPSRSTIRAATPTQRTPTLSSAPSISTPPIKSSPSVTKPASTTTTKPAPSRGTSPTVKSRPWRPSDIPGFSLNAPPNLRTSVAERPLSASRGRPGVPTSRSSFVEPASNGRPRRQSCSPSRGRPPNGFMHTSGSSVPAVSRGHSRVDDNVSPVVIGTKMVERVINMRKLVPPKQDDKHSPHGSLSGKSASPEGSGFGRTLSKKSLDMAIRHMDIRRSIPSNLRPLMTNIPASSMYSVRSGHARNRTVSAADSPLATSSNASSEVSVNNNSSCLDGLVLENDIGTDRGRSPLRGR